MTPPCPLLSEEEAADLAELPAAAAALRQRSPQARIVLVYGEPEPWQLAADAEARPVVRGRRLADVLPPRNPSGPRAAGRAAVFLIGLLVALVTACTTPPRERAADHGAELARVGADGPKSPGPLVALDRDRPAPIPPAPTPWDLYGAAMVAGAAVGYSFIRWRHG